MGKPLITSPVCLFYVASCIFVASCDDYCNAGHSSPPGNRLWVQYSPVVTCDDARWLGDVRWVDWGCLFSPDNEKNFFKMVWSACTMRYPIINTCWYMYLSVALLSSTGTIMTATKSQELEKRADNPNVQKSFFNSEFILIMAKQMRFSFGLVLV